MLKRSKAISIVLAFVFCMSFLAPGLVAPQAAQAAVTYEVLKAPNVDISDSKSDLRDLGTVKVSIPDVRVLSDVYEEYFTVGLPSGVEFSSSSSATLLTTPDEIVIADVGDLDGDDSVTLKIKKGVAGDNDVSFLINFDQMYIKNGSGDIEAKFSSPGSVFATGSAVIAKIGDGDTTTTIGSVKSIGDAGGKIENITIKENMPGVLKAGDEIKLRLPNGFSWDIATDSSYVEGGWGLTGVSDADVTDGTSDRDILVTLGDNFTKSVKTAGKLTVKNLRINVDDVAKLGEIEVNVSGNSDSDVTEEDIIVAKYGDFGVTVTENKVEEVTAGHDGQKIGSFYIEEDLVGSLVTGRALYLELPSGVKWDKLPQVKTEDGDSNVLSKSSFSLVSNSSSRKVKAQIENASTDDAVKLLIEKGEVYVQPGFEGDIEIEVSGSAGIEGTVKVAEAVKAVEFTAEKAPNVVIGQQGVKAANMTIKENKKGAIKEDADIVLALDDGYKFYKEPTVKVVEGNLEIDDVDINSDDELVITIDSESTKASTIEITDVYLVGYRYAPEGKVVAKLVEAEGTGADSAKVTGSTALDSLYGFNKDDADKEYSEKSAGEVVVANCVTPADAAGTTTFRIDSNIYTINGVSKVMDVAPYIKGDRTFMPIRYVAYALGLNDDDIVWDEAAQKVTLTKGDVVVEMVIGSTTITVNGEAQTMDVAPEIANSRTMLPARFVAEAFGANVGWDPATRTVIID